MFLATAKCLILLSGVLKLYSSATSGTYFNCISRHCPSACDARALPRLFCWTRGPRFPRRGLEGRNFSHLAGQLRVGEPLAHDLTHGEIKPVRIVKRIIFCGAIVVSENLLVNVSLQVERFDGDVGSIQTTLKQLPEILHAVDVNLPTHIALGFVDHFMHKP